MNRAKNEDQIRILLDAIGDKTSPDFYLLVPVKACQGCVEEILIFVRSHLKNDKITFVLTSNESKIFSLLLTPEELNSGNILLDKEALLEKSGIVNSSFLLLKVNHEHFEEQKTLNAANLTFELEKLNQLLIN